MVNFQLKDIPMTTVNSTENIPGSLVPQVQAPLPNETPIELAKNRKFNHVSRSSFPKFMTESPAGSAGDSVFIRKCFREVFASGVRAVANLTGKGHTENGVKEKLDGKGVNYCQALLTTAYRAPKVNFDLLLGICSFDSFCSKIKRTSLKSGADKTFIFKLEN